MTPEQQLLDLKEQLLQKVKLAYQAYLHEIQPYLDEIVKIESMFAPKQMLLELQNLPAEAQELEYWRGINISEHWSNIINSKLEK